MKNVLLIIMGLSLGAWFLLDESTSVFEKLMSIVLVIFIYVFAMICTGASSVDQILAPIMSLLI